MSARGAAGVAGRPGRRPASGRLALWLRNRRRDGPGPCLGGRVVAWGLGRLAPATAEDPLVHRDAIGGSAGPFHSS